MMLPLVPNPALLATAGLAIGGMAVKRGLTSGQQRYERLQQGSDQTGIDVADLQKRAYISQGIGGEEFGLDKQIDMLSDTQEKIGEALSEGSFNKKGEFTGGGGAGDLINALVRSGALEANKESVKAYFADAEKNMGNMIDTIFDDVNSNIKDESSRRFVLESLASDLGKLNNAMNQNQAKVQQLTKSYEQNNVGLTDEDISRLKQADSMFATISATMSNFSLKFYNGFSKAFGNETQSKMSEFFNTLSKLAEPLGQLIGYAIQPLIKHLRLLTKALSAIVDGVNLTIEAFNTVSNKIRAFGADVLSMFTDLASKIKNALVGMLPSWMSSNDDKKDKKPSKNTKPQTQVHGYSTSSLPTYNPYAQVPSVPTVPVLPKVNPPEPTAQSTQPSINNNNNITVNPVVNTTVELDGEKIGNVVSNTSSFKNGVYTSIQPLFMSGE